ncbi:class A beta-lactamase [Rhizobium sp. P44RR-XXIV]|uniref:class A beta-lactamase n=1 Tax=Rhizobium sp. P44RR-XXIV TaxID=1921145 RepID=UPI000986429C|nr:class A beta-lactamase [Rhizobium sp. P44RR-XXIV]TIX91627.1 class A beta-lactamase [Rhizobium sp. P44RR-XXIV]
MSVTITRRVALMTPFLAMTGLLGSHALAKDSDKGIAARFKKLEKRSGGRLGVAVLNTATGQLAGNRLDERFAMCSTFKALAVAFTLSRVDRGQEQLDRRIFFKEGDLVTPFKATKPHLADGMTIEQLCEAALIVSDSTAANLLLASFGGPAALTGYLRSLGDPVTRLDRIELDLNIVKPGETHDTTSPRAMVATLQKIILGDALSAASRAKLTNWMIASKDAAAQRLRVGLPNGWRIANKPGTWNGISTNDIGVIFPPGRDPIVVAAYLGEAPGSIKDHEAILAEVARIVAEEI